MLSYFKKRKEEKEKLNELFELNESYSMYEYLETVLKTMAEEEYVIKERLNIFTSDQGIGVKYWHSNGISDEVNLIWKGETVANFYWSVKTGFRCKTYIFVGKELHEAKLKESEKIKSIKQYMKLVYKKKKIKEEKKETIELLEVNANKNRIRNQIK